MEQHAAKHAFEAYSRGEISRAELSRRIGRDIDFAEALVELSRLGLRLPRYNNAVNEAGVDLIRDLALQDPA